MQKEVMKANGRKPIEKLNVVRNFKKVIEARDSNHMQRELYEFLHLHCGFIAHYDIHGFRATYSDPQDFADVFIRHFDREHQYFSACYACHNEPYRDTGYTKAEIKKAFTGIVELHKKAIEREAKETKRNAMHEVYLNLKEIFEADKIITVSCDACGNTYRVTVKTNDNGCSTDFRTICCLFCGRQIKLNRKEVVADVEQTETEAAQPYSQTL